MQPVSEIVLDFTSFHVGYCRGPLAMTQRGTPWRIARFPAGIAVLRHPQRGTILFDTGYGALFEQATKPFPERIYRWLTPVTFNPDDSLPKQLEKYGLASPDLVFLSHLHADHVAGLFDLATIPPVISSLAAIEKLQAGRLATLKAGCPAMIRDKLQSLNLQAVETLPRISLAPYGLSAFGDGYDLLGDQSALVVALPGHGFGQTGLFLPATTQGAIFLVADAIWSLEALKASRLPPDMTLRRLGDRDAFVDTFARLRAFHLAHPQVRIMASHCTEAYPMNDGEV
ncbi:MBL fold metallo-hydrolase [Pseudochrobactrum kiredjianiae]|uniref:MBL fold metallo-hydrolase n=1 Tax=Pseudochrobactrum kiredjianiae TaxID=386305 RepID=A0ABW3V4K4_9HYPH|nr:MBL fold metallo-hydrolase [Pseudochrobactrum kiredjianiae]MDM7850678.1 MBL fold metallo-hydrolase [Pseudochrobactrum kiredjianiae]